MKPILRPPGATPQVTTEEEAQRIVQSFLINPGPRPPGFVARAHRTKHLTFSEGISAGHGQPECRIYELSSWDNTEQNLQAPLEQRTTQPEVADDLKLARAKLRQLQENPDPELSKMQIRVRRNMLQAEILLLESGESGRDSAHPHLELAEEYLARMSPSELEIASSPPDVLCHAASSESVVSSWSGEGGEVRSLVQQPHVQRAMVLEVVNRLSQDAEVDLSRVEESCAYMTEQLEGLHHRGRRPSVQEMALGMGVFTYLQEQSQDDKEIVLDLEEDGGKGTSWVRQPSDEYLTSSIPTRHVIRAQSEGSR